MIRRNPSGSPGTAPRLRARRRRSSLVAVPVVLALLLVAGGAGASAPPPEHGPKEAPGDGVPGRYVVVYERSVANVDAETNRQERAKGFRATFRYRQALTRSLADR